MKGLTVVDVAREFGIHDTHAGQLGVAVQVRGRYWNPGQPLALRMISRAGRCPASPCDPLYLEVSAPWMMRWMVERPTLSSVQVGHGHLALGVSTADVAPGGFGQFGLLCLWVCRSSWPGPCPWTEPVRCGELRSRCAERAAQVDQRSVQA